MTAFGSCMKLRPEGEPERNRATFRLLIFCLLLCAVSGLMASHVQFCDDGSTFYWMRAAFPRGGIHVWLVFSLDMVTGVAVLLLGISLMFIFGWGVERDVKYGRAGVCISVCSQLLWFLYNNAVQL